jgi:hypothetical protein
VEDDNRGESRPESNSGRTDVQTAMTEMMSAAERARDELLYAHRRACFLLFVTRNEGGSADDVQHAVQHAVGILEGMTKSLLTVSVWLSVAAGAARGLHRVEKETQR